MPTSVFTTGLSVSTYWSLLHCFFVPILLHFPSILILMLDSPIHLLYSFSNTLPLCAPLFSVTPDINPFTFPCTYSTLLHYYSNATANLFLSSYLSTSISLLLTTIPSLFYSLSVIGALASYKTTPTFDDYIRKHPVNIVKDMQLSIVKDMQT